MQKSLIVHIDFSSFIYLKTFFNNRVKNSVNVFVKCLILVLSLFICKMKINCINFWLNVEHKKVMFFVRFHFRLFNNITSRNLTIRYTGDFLVKFFYLGKFVLFFDHLFISLGINILDNKILRHWKVDPRPRFFKTFYGRNLQKFEISLSVLKIGKVFCYEKGLAASTHAHTHTHTKKKRLAFRRLKK